MKKTVHAKFRKATIRIFPISKAKEAVFLVQKIFAILCFKNVTTNKK